MRRSVPVHAAAILGAILVCGSFSIARAQAVPAGAAPAAGADVKAMIEAEWARQDVRPQGVPLSQADAAGAVDGRKTGTFAFHTENEQNPWWQVDLGPAQPLSHLLLFNRCECDMDRVAKIVVLLSDDAKTWREIYRHDGTIYGGIKDNKPLRVDMKGAAGRFLRLQLAAKTWFHLDEVEAYPAGDPKKNIALNRPADQSSTSQWSVRHAVPVSDPANLPVQAVIDRGRQLAAELAKAGVDCREGLAELDKAQAAAAAPAAAPQARRDAYLQARWAIRKMVLAHPLLKLDKLLFVKRQTFQSSHIYTDYFDGSTLFGGNLCVLSPVSPDGKVTELVPVLSGGIFERYDLSFDAKRIVFSYKGPKSGGYRLYEVGSDGTGLRQLTHDGADEGEMLRQFHHGYDDLDPCYLPNGDIMFASTRSKRAVLCNNAFTSTTLFVMDRDGGHVRCVSGNTVNEFTPAVMEDGRVIYTRWEYVDKGCGDVQSLWCMHPDGTHASHIYKNNVRRPATLIDARSVPGSHLLVAVGAPHMPLAVGPVIRIDIYQGQLDPEAMTNLTPEIQYPGHAGYPTGDMGYYKEPWPLSKDLFLVTYNGHPAHNAPAGYGLYVFTASNHRELLYRDPAISCWQPMPLRPRPRPPVLCSQIGEPPAKPAPARATLVMTDVYQGLTGIERGRVKYLRIMEDVPKPWESSYNTPSQGDCLGLQNPAIGLKGHLAIKKMHGITPVREDGSACFLVEPNKNLFFQALDENFMELQRMRTFVNLMPGETRSCIGCHEPRRNAPSPKLAQAPAAGAVELAAQPGDATPARAIHYPLDVQPVLDKHCVRCHGGAKPKADLDLSGEMTTLFCRSYENLINRKLINNIDVDPRDAYIPAEPPLTFGSFRSKMIIQLLKGHNQVKLSQAEFARVVTWIDANAPYYGLYEGKKNIRWKDQGDFRPVPVASR